MLWHSVTEYQVIQMEWFDGLVSLRIPQCKLIGQKMIALGKFNRIVFSSHVIFCLDGLWIHNYSILRAVRHWEWWKLRTLHTCEINKRHDGTIDIRDYGLSQLLLNENIPAVTGIYIKKVYQKNVWESPKNSRIKRKKEIM